MARTQTAPTSTGVDRSPWVWRTRYQMMPVYGGVLALILGGASYTLTEQQFYIAAGAMVVMFGMLIKHRCFGRRRKDAANAFFLSVVLIIFTGIVVAMRLSLLTFGWIAVAVLVAVAVLGLFWWLSKQNIRRVEIEKEIEAWPDFAERIGLKAVKRGMMKATETGRRVWLSWDRDSGMTIDQVEAHVKQLGNYFEIPYGQAKFERNKEGDTGFISPNGIWLVENTKSSIHREPIPFDEPTMKRITDEMLIGQSEDNNLIKVQWYIKGWGGKHTITAGKTGCIAPETRIYLPDTDTHVRVDELARRGEEITVLSWTPEGVVRARTQGAPFVKGEAELFEVKCLGGASLRVTDEHRFLTINGWKPLADIRRNNDGVGQYLRALEWDEDDDDYLPIGGWDRIVSVQPTGIGTFYDLTVPGPANYVAEGLVHHNSGKSSLFDLTFAESALCRDVVRWGMDRKGGTALIPWAPMFDWIATSDEACGSMLAALVEVLEYRGKYSAKMGWRGAWKASPRHPVIIVVLDEAAEILGLGGKGGWDASALAASAARRARSLGVILFFAVQHLNLDSIGSTQITNNCDRRFCFGMKSSAQQNSIMQGSTQIFDATQVELPKQAGTFWWTDGGEPSGVAARVRYVNEQKVHDIVTMVGENITDLDRESAKAAQKGSAAFGEHCYDERKRWLLEDLPPVGGADNEDDEDEWEYELTEDGPTVGDPDDPSISATSSGTDDPTTDDAEDQVPNKADEVSVEEMVDTQDPDEVARARDEFLGAHYPEQKVPEPEALQRLDAALDSAGPEGIARRDLVKRVGRMPTWVYERVSERLNAGLVEALGEGKATRYRRPAGGNEGEKHLRLVRPQ